MHVLWATNLEPDGSVIDLRPHFRGEPAPTPGEQIAAGPANPTARMVPNRRARRWLRDTWRRARHYLRLVPTAAFILFLAWLAVASFALFHGGK